MTPWLTILLRTSNSNIEQILVDEHGKEWFVAKDVAELLEYKNTRKAVIDLCKIAISDGVANRDPFGGEQKIQIVPRPDFYLLNTKSNLPAVEEFVLLDGEVQKKGTHIMSTLEPELENSRLKR